MITSLTHKLLIMRNLKLLFNCEYSCRIFTNSVFSSLQNYTITRKTKAQQLQNSILNKYYSHITDFGSHRILQNIIVHRSVLPRPQSVPLATAAVVQLEKICWSCGKCKCKVPPKVSGKFFCCCCGIIQGIKNKNNETVHDYFSLFDLPIQFDLSEKELHKAFLCIQAQLHPDKFSQKSEVLYIT